MTHFVFEITPSYILPLSFWESLHVWKSTYIFWFHFHLLEKLITLYFHPLEPHWSHSNAAFLLDHTLYIWRGPNLRLEFSWRGDNTNEWFGFNMSEIYRRTWTALINSLKLSLLLQQISISILVQRWLDKPSRLNDSKKGEQVVRAQKYIPRRLLYNIFTLSNPNTKRLLSSAVSCCYSIL